MTTHILISGASGYIGRELIKRLQQEQRPVRALVRSRTSAALLPNNVDSVIADPSDKVSLESVFDDIAQLFIVMKDNPQQAQQEKNLIDTARDNGVKQIVKVSAFAAGLAPPVGYGKIHAEVENYLQRTGTDWTILRPYAFMQNFLDLTEPIRSVGIVPMPFGQAKVSLIDARDVASVAYHVLSDSRHIGQTYELTGSETLTMHEYTEKLGQLLQRKIKYISPPAFIAGLMMRMQGVSAWDVQMRKELFSMIKAGGEANTTSTVADLTDKTPIKFEEFVKDHLDRFRK